MRIDLHAHSDRSDGTLSPTELVQAAVDADVDVLAVTDHDCFDGWDEAVEAAVEHRLTLVRGIEISCRYDGQSVHLLGFLPDPSHQPLLEELERVLDGRNARLPAILARLHDLGIDVTVDEVRRVSAEAAATGRPHVADALVARGFVRDRDEAFARYLSPGRPAYVHRYAANLSEMIALVREAGGVCVIAHPWGRSEHSSLSREAFASLTALGLAGLEVDHEDHSPEQRDDLRRIAKELDLVVTGGSDFHGAGKVGHELACNTTSPEEYHRLLELAAAAAEWSGRLAPRVVEA